MKQYSSNLLSICLMALVLISCESLDSDNALLPTQSEIQTAYVSAKSATVIDLFAEKGFDNNAAVTITQEPSQGTVKLLPSGKAVYIPNRNVSNGKDTFQYTITQNNETNSGQVDIDIVTDTTDLPCQDLILADIVRIDSNCVTTAGKDIDVLANDAFCNNSIDYGSLEVISGPLYGDIEVSQNGYITYFVENLPHRVDFDVFVYKVTTTGSNPQVGYAPVIIYFTYHSCCTALPQAMDDDLFITNTANGASKAINVTDNDVYCKNTLDSISFTIIQQPRHGSVSLSVHTQDEGIFTYQANGAYNGTDSFTYQFCDQQQNCTSATVNVDISYQASCQSQAWADDINIMIDSTDNAIDSLTQAEKDSFQLTGNETVVILDVTANDQVCSGDFLQIKTPISNPSQGRVAVVRNMLIYIHKPSFFGNVSFNYGLCSSNTNCVTADVFLQVLQ